MAPSPRPDPSAGVFETLLVAAGRSVEEEAHAGRLADALAALYGTETPAGAWESARERAAGIELGRLRLTVAPTGGAGFDVDVVGTEVDPTLVFPRREWAVELRGLVVAGGLGPHKWVDRAPLEEAEARMPERAVPLLLDADGAVLEASRASIFAARGGVLLTPPADGRILPGIARRRVLEIAGEEGIDVREVELRLDELLQADEVFLTGSVRGVEPVGSVDGTGLHPKGGLSARIGADLRRRWLG